MHALLFLKEVLILSLCKLRLRDTRDLPQMSKWGSQLIFWARSRVLSPSRRRKVA